MELTKLAIINLARTMEGMNYKNNDLIYIEVERNTNRPYIILGPKDEYGHTPKLILDDAGFWNFYYGEISADTKIDIPQPSKVPHVSPAGEIREKKPKKLFEQIMHWPSED